MPPAAIRRLTPVQRAVLRIEEEDRDVLVSAGTGSGKTVAFGLMLARRLTGAGGRMPWAAGPQALVIVPTRELAMQVRAELAWLFAGGGARIGCCTGGSDQRAERAALAAGLDIVVGTPGRLGGHLRLGALRTGHVACVVLDEADQMLGADFRAELEAVLRALPEAPADDDVLGHGERRRSSSWRGGSSATRCASTSTRRAGSSCRGWRWRGRTARRRW